jgi:hypothetical protein
MSKIQHRAVIEGDIQKPVIAYARKGLGLRCTKMDVRNSAGIPDYLIWMPSKLLLIEFKKPNGEPTPLQAETHKELRKLGYEIHVIDNIEQGKELLRRTLAQRTKAYRMEALAISNQVHEKAPLAGVRRGVVRSRTR